MPDFAGFVHTAAGAGSDGLVIKLYARNDHAGTAVANTITNSNGYWAISHGTEGLFDVEVVIDDSNKYRIRYDDQIQCELGEFGQLYLRGANDAFATKLASTPTASRTITFPDATATALLGGYANTNSGVMSLTSTANSAAAVYLHANGGTSETVKIYSNQGTSVTEGAESVNILSDAGGVGIRSTANLANAVNITVDGGTTSTMTLFNDQGTAATEGAASIQLLSDVGGINIKSGLDAADAILLTADGGTSEKIRIHADQGTGVDSIELTSDAGGIELNVVSSVGITGSAILDEDGMGSNSAIHLATQQSIKAYVDAQVDTADTLAELSDTNISSPAIGHILVYDNTASVWDNVAINAADGLTATLGDGTLELDLDAALTTVTSLLATDIKIGEDDQTKIDFETADEIHFYAANVEQVYLADNIFGPQSDSDVDLGTTGVRWKDAYIDTITTTGLVTAGSLTVTGTTTLNGNLILGDAAADTLTVSATIQGATPLVFEGASSGLYETSFAIADPSADRTITFPDLTGTVALTGVAQAWSTTGTVATGALTATGDTIVGNGYGLVVGHSSQQTANEAYELQVLGTGGADSGAILGRWLANSGGPALRFLKSRNGTIGSHTIVNDDDTVIKITANPDDGVDYDTEAAMIVAEVDDASPAAGDIGMRWAFSTMGGGGVGLTEALRIDSNQDTSIPLGKKFAFDSGVGDTYIYQESADDLHIKVGNVAYLEIDQDIDSLRLGTTASGPNGRWQVAIGGDHTSDGGGTNAAVTMFDGTITGAAGDTEFLAGLRIEPNVTTQTTDQNIGYAATVVIAEPGITEQLGGSSTIGVAATLYIQGAPTQGDVDAAIYVASGDVRLADGDMYLDQGKKIYFDGEQASPNDYFYSHGGSGLSIYLAGSQRQIFSGGRIESGNRTTANPAYSFLSDNDTGFASSATNTAELVTNGVARLYADASGGVFIGDTLNANMTVGLTINQGANDNEILAFKSSDVAHGMTGLLETDTYGKFQKHSAGGGLTIVGASNDTEDTPLFMQAYSGDLTPDTTDDVNSTSVIQLETYIKSGTSVTAIPDAANSFSVRGGAGTRLLIKGTGVIHVTNTTLVALDDQPDALVVRAMQKESSHSGIIEGEHDNPFYDGAWLRERGLLGEGAPGEALFAIQPRMAAHEGAIWQNYTNHMSLADKVDGLEVELIEAKKQLAAISA